MQHKRIHVKPATGLVVSKPSGGRLSAAGEIVPLDSYWSRRLVAGDVERVEQPKKTSATPKAGEHTKA
jgi:hypothetical protein